MKNISPRTLYVPYSSGSPTYNWYLMQRNFCFSCSFLWVVTVSSCHIDLLCNEAPLKATNRSFIFCDQKKCHEILYIFKSDLVESWGDDLHQVTNFVIFRETIKFNYLPSIATFRSQFTALYPYTQNPGNTCISQLYNKPVICLENYSFVSNLSVSNICLIKTHYLLREPSFSSVLTLWQNCFTYSLSFA